MLQTKFRTAALASSAVFVLALAGCSAKEPADTQPTLSQPAEAAPPPADRADLAGAAPAAEAPPADGLLGGPIAQPKPVAVSSSDDSRLKTWRRADGTLVTAMRPIANPRANPREARPAARPHARPHHARPTQVAAARPAPVVVKPAAKPAPRPAVVAARPAPVKAAPVAPAPKTVAQAPALKPVAPPAKPAVVAKAPTPAIAAPAASAAPAAAKLSPKVEKLQAAVAPAATSGAVLATAESLKTGKEGQVTLSLPATLGDMIKQQAAKLGIGKPAKKVSAYADLEGQGYEITPNGRQTATVKPGEPTTFAWQVKPTEDATGQLTTSFGASLDGAKPAQPFSLGAISKQVAAVPEKAKQAAAGFKLPAFLDAQYEVPGVGKVPGKSLLGAGLVLLALIILVAISRNAAKAKERAERRRKFRTLHDYGRNEPEFDTPKAQDVAYVNPMVAAAGGAIAGAAATAMFNHHQEAKAEEAAAQAAEHEPFPAPAYDSPQVQHVSETAHVEPAPETPAQTHREPEPVH
ncbi:stalk-specific protein StpX [Caulobacter endophyticus]|uniref:Stalk-specific protein X n=1 Tax=Caulobacter endophyticus TaxID=2172652 RepID=A0A2T9JSG5_9CAUL|nr:hypothetical protein [Caulobacter endophyticus]PVM86647.1 hypothetical protein DDF67_15060 [Caulobacter endophyticus]